MNYKKPVILLVLMLTLSLFTTPVFAMQIFVRSKEHAGRTELHSEAESPEHSHHL